MKIWGKIFGSIIGISAGPFGIVFGFIIGHLIDQLTIKVRDDNTHKNSTDYHLLSKNILNIFHYALGKEGIVSLFNQNLFNSFCTAHQIPQIKKNNFNKRKSVPDKTDLIRACVYTYNSPKYDNTLKEDIISLLHSCHSEADLRKRISEINEIFIAMSKVPLSPEDCRILGIHPYSNEDDVKQAFRRLAAEYHPDKQETKGDNETFIKIRTAYERLIKELRSR